MNDHQQHTSVPAETYVQALKEQRNLAYDQAAEWYALALHHKADVDRLTAEVEKLRGESDGPIGGS